MSSFMPALTRSSSPTRLPFLPFPFSSGIGSSCQISRSCKQGRAPAPHGLLRSQERSVIVELAWLTLGPLIKLGYIHENLPVRGNFHLGPIHGSRRRTFKVDS